MTLSEQTLREVYGEEFAVPAKYLSFTPRFISQTLTSGLWLCDTLEDVAAIGINAVCLRTQDDWKGLRCCSEFLGSFYFLLIVCASPERRAVIESQVIQLGLSVPVFSVPDSAFLGCQSAADVYAGFGQKGIDRFLMNAKELPAYGILEVSDVKAPDISKMEKVTSGIAALDSTVGGFMMGQLSVWTGRRGNGKSTLLGQLLQEAIDQGFSVCAYSGELAAWQFKYWVTLQAAGPSNIILKTDPITQKSIPAVNDVVQRRIDDWWRGRFLLYDIGMASAHDEDSILQIFDYAHRKYGAKVFLVDNIMTASFKQQRDGDYYRSQSNFVGRLVSFAKQNNVHVHLVAHPRKTTSTGGKHITNDDVGGIGDITNRADNVFSLERETCSKPGEPVSERTVLSVLKNRFYGDKANIGLDFDAQSKRFFKFGKKPNKKFGWDLCGEQTALPDDTQVPFSEEGDST